MDVLAEILRTVLGRIHFMIYLGKSPAAEIEVKNKDIIVNILNPLIAIELGLEEILSKKGKKDINMIERIKKAGYSIRIKYKMLELDL